MTTTPGQPEPSERDALAEKVERAHAEIARLCDGGRWRMSIPADPKRDSDPPVVSPVWAEGIPNDGKWEYTATADCDGSNMQFHRRRPAMASPVGPWESASKRAWADALNAQLGLTVADTPAADDEGGQGR